MIHHSEDEQPQSSLQQRSPLSGSADSPSLPPADHGCSRDAGAEVSCRAAAARPSAVSVAGSAPQTKAGRREGAREPAAGERGWALSRREGECRRAVRAEGGAGRASARDNLTGPGGPRGASRRRIPKAPGPTPPSPRPARARAAICRGPVPPPPRAAPTRGTHRVRLRLRGPARLGAARSGRLPAPAKRLTGLRPPLRCSTWLQGAEQARRRAGDAAPLLEDVAEDGAHAAARALPLEASPAAPQRARQPLLPHGARGSASCPGAAGRRHGAGGRAAAALRASGGLQCGQRSGGAGRKREDKERRREKKEGGEKKRVAPAHNPSISA